jgi:hypothetical protein
MGMHRRLTPFTKLVELNASIALFMEHFLVLFTQAQTLGVNIERPDVYAEINRNFLHFDIRI